MELNDAKHFLNQASYFELRIKTRMEELEKLEKVQSSELKVQRAPAGAGELTQKIEALKEEIRRDIDSLVTQKREILRMIGQLSKPEYQTVLELRYLRGWDWKRIALNMHFHERYILKLHAAALKNLSELL